MHHLCFAEFRWNASDVLLVTKNSSCIEENASTPSQKQVGHSSFDLWKEHCSREESNIIESSLIIHHGWITIKARKDFSFYLSFKMRAVLLTSVYRLEVHSQGMLGPFQVQYAQLRMLLKQKFIIIKVLGPWDHGVHPRGLKSFQGYIWKCSGWILSCGST